MQTHSVILWMTKADFLLYKRFLAGGTFHREYGPFVMIRKIAPCSEMDALVRAEELHFHHTLNDSR